MNHCMRCVKNNAVNKYLETFDFVVHINLSPKHTKTKRNSDEEDDEKELDETELQSRGFLKELQR